MPYCLASCKIGARKVNRLTRKKRVDIEHSNILKEKYKYGMNQCCVECNWIWACG